MANPKDKRIVINELVADVAKTAYADDDLYDIVKGELGDWTIDDLKEAGPLALTYLRDFMLNRGVYVKNHRTPGGNQFQAMVDTIAADTRLEWPPASAIALARVKRMKTHDPALQQLLGHDLIEPTYVLHYSRKHDGDKNVPPQVPPPQAKDEEDDMAAWRLSLDTAAEDDEGSGNFEETDVLDGPAAVNEDDTRGGMNADERATLPADATPAPASIVLYADKLAAENDEDNGADTPHLMGTASHDEDEDGQRTARFGTSTSDDAVDSQRVACPPMAHAEEVLQLYEGNKTGAQMAAITRGAVRCGHDRPTKTADKMFAMAKDDEPPDRPGDGHSQRPVCELIVDELLSLPQESQVVIFSPVSSSHHVGKGTRGGVSEHRAIKRQYVAQSTRGAYYVMSPCHSEAAFCLSATAKHMVHAAHTWFRFAGRPRAGGCLRPASSRTRR